MGQHEAAVGPLREALARSPDLSPAHRLLAVVYAELGREEEARAEVGEILRISPDASLDPFDGAYPTRTRRNWSGTSRPCARPGCRSSQCPLKVQSAASLPSCSPTSWATRPSWRRSRRRGCGRKYGTERPSAHRSSVTVGISLKTLVTRRFSIFRNALDAVNCALAIQEEVVSDPILMLHIGIHTSDVLIRPGEISGDGVNIAARICAISDGDGAFVSAEVQQAVRNQQHLKTEALGDHDFKNVDRPVTVFRVRGEAGTPSPVAAPTSRTRA